VYDNLGNEVTLDVYYTKTTDTPPTTDWEVTVYNAADRDPATGGFPYGAANIGTSTIQFDTTTGQRTGAVTAVNITVPNGGTYDIDLKTPPTPMQGSR
jgi:flagellar hook protein FlgE